MVLLIIIFNFRLPPFIDGDINALFLTERRDKTKKSRGSLRWEIERGILGAVQYSMVWYASPGPFQTQLRSHYRHCTFPLRTEEVQAYSLIRDQRI